MFKNQIINSCIDYILANLEKELTVYEIANYCGFSKFYLSRLFKEETGESIYSFIKRIKVEQNRTITEIGSDYGYSPSNYATLFSKHFTQSPKNFRKEIIEKSINYSFFYGKKNKIETFEEVCKKIKIQILPNYFVLYERHKGNYKNLASDWDVFLEKK